MTIIVPVFNEEQTLTELFNHLDKLKAKLTKLDISFFLLMMDQLIILLKF